MEAGGLLPEMGGLGSFSDWAAVQVCPVDSLSLTFVEMGMW